jgi:hypothetical protein
MACCGQSGARYRGWTATRRSFSSPLPGQPQPATTPVSFTTSTAVTAPLRYVKQGGVAVRGPVTGRRYAFSVATPVQEVDSRDLAALLRTSLFRRA